MKTVKNHERGKDIKLVQKTSANRDICIFYSVLEIVFSLIDFIHCCRSEEKKCHEDITPQHMDLYVQSPQNCQSFLGSNIWI